MIFSRKSIKLWLWLEQQIRRVINQKMNQDEVEVAQQDEMEDEVEAETKGEYYN